MALITLQQVRDEGVTTQQASDARLTFLIQAATIFINRVTRQFFEPQTLTLKLNGNGHRRLHLPIFCASLTALTICGSDRLADVVNYNSTFPCDDRMNPKLEFHERFFSDVDCRYSRIYGYFEKGVQNVSVTGIFGYVDITLGNSGPVYSVPFEIQMACLHLVIAGLPLLTAPNQLNPTGSGGVGGITEEHFDNETYSYKRAQSAPLHSMYEALWTNDPYVNQILLNYQKPISGDHT